MCGCVYKAGQNHKAVSLKYSCVPVELQSVDTSGELRQSSFNWFVESLMEQKHNSSKCVFWTLSMPFKQQTHGSNFDQQTCSKQEDNNELPCSAEVS